MLHAMLYGSFMFCLVWNAWLLSENSCAMQRVAVADVYIECEEFGMGRVCPICLSRSESNLKFAKKIDNRRITSHSFASRKLPEYMHHDLYFCKICELLWADPDSSMDFETGYHEAAYDSAMEAVYAAKTYTQVLTPVFDKLQNRAMLLDIGAGDGAFLAEAGKFGFSSLAGVEPSGAALRCAAPDVAACIRHGFFQAGLFAPGEVSAVTCFQTIEHLPQPLETCSEVFRILEPNGLFCLIAHNRQSFVNRIFGRKSPIFDIEHLQLFCQNSIANLLRRAGFDDVKVFGFSNRYPLSYWIRLFPFPSLVKSAIKSFLPESVARVSLSIDVGNMLVVAKKKGSSEDRFQPPELTERWKFQTCDFRKSAE
jgi:SAM-dependent methyltransferase